MSTHNEMGQYRAKRGANSVKKITIPENDFLKAFYELENLNKLTAYFNVSRKVITKMAKQYNVSFNLHPKHIKITENLLRKLYEEDNLTQKEISNKLNVSLSTVRDRFLFYNIDSCRLMQRKLTQLEVDVIVGSVLGDGHITDSSNLDISHSEKQLNYLLYKQNLLANICKGTGIEFLQKRNFPNGTSSYKVRTVGHIGIREIQTKFYQDKVKVIPKDIESLLTPQSIAIWYMDDGGRKGKCYGRIATCCFTLEEVTLLANTLNNKFDLNVEVAKECQYYNLKFRARNDSFKRLTDLISPYVPECMSYKLP